MVNALEWFEEAKVDLAAAENLGQAKLYSIACFHCQQAAEKALKAALIKSTGTFPKIHSLRQLASDAKLLGQMSDEVALLEGDYTTSRYPGVYGQAPRLAYNSKLFLQRLVAAKQILKVIAKWMKN